MLVLLNGVADAEWLAGMDVIEKMGAVEHDTVHYLAAGVIDQLKLYMLIVAPHECASAEIHHTPRAEYRFVVSGSERVELAQKA